MSEFTPLRSVLYMPSSNERALEKAKTIACDALILDLEDAVAPDAKSIARDQVCTAVREGRYGSRYRPPLALIYGVGAAILTLVLFLV